MNLNIVCLHFQSKNQNLCFVHITLDNDLFALHCSVRLSVRTHEPIAQIANGKNIFELNAVVSEELIDILKNGMLLQHAV